MLQGFRGHNTDWRTRCRKPQQTFPFTVEVARPAKRHDPAAMREIGPTTTTTTTTTGTTTMSREVKCCLFDMDGLLLDTESLYTVAQQQILDRFGLTFTWELKAQMMGKKALDAAQVLIDTLQLGDRLTAEGFVTEREQVLDVLFATAPLMPGVDKLVRHLAAHNVPIAVATSSHRRHFDLKTSTHRDLFSLFNFVITGDEVENGKPHPQIFNTAKTKLEGLTGELQPTQCLVFEDAPSGVEAAIAAGMWCVMVPDAKLDLALTSKAHQVLPSLEGFQPQDWGMAPFP